MSNNNFFWLHIRKAGGTSFRKSFMPPYIETDQGNHTKPFVALPKNQWNAAINNYRLPLGEYDYKRLLFAKKFLYEEEEFNNMFKFVIVRNPYDRAVSCWKYLTSFNSIKQRPHRFISRYNFRYFLSTIEEEWEKKEDRHFATHTAPIWGDISDENGKKLLVDEVFKLESIDKAIQQINERLGTSIKSYSKVNVSKKRATNYREYYNKKTRKMVETLYEDDIKNLGYEF